jgi:hypothetical protein
MSGGKRCWRAIRQGAISRRLVLPIVELEHNQLHTETRIRDLLPRYESGSIFHIKGECADLEEELLTFPKSITDDVINCLPTSIRLRHPITTSHYRTKTNPTPTFTISLHLLSTNIKMTTKSITR